MNCRNCGLKRGLHSHYEYPEDLWCGDCYEQALDERAENAINEAIEFKKRTRRKVAPVVYNGFCLVCNNMHVPGVACPLLKVTC